MRELSDLHSCATCMHSTAMDLNSNDGSEAQVEFSLMDVTSLADFISAQAGRLRAASLLECEYQRETLGEDCVAAVKVHYDGRCASYACRRDLFKRAYGFNPEIEDEEEHEYASSVGLRLSNDFNALS